MSMNFAEAHAAIEDAQRTLHASDAMIWDMIQILAKRLPHLMISGHVRATHGRYLADLKRTLRQFDIPTHHWKRP